MGSEFAYEDLSSQEVAKYSYGYVGEDTFSNKTGHVIERFPVDLNSGYSKQVAWVDDQEWLIHKIEYYDRKGTLLKTLTYHDYRQYPNKKWRADEMLMVNHQSGKSTTLKLSDIQFNQKMSNRDFNKNALKRAR